jgi:threonine dehydratase
LAVIVALLSHIPKEKLLVELARSCSIAALCSENISFDLGRRCAVIICGGNISFERVFELSAKR